ncbi:MAG: ABC transporter substrate-binding protein [Alphaproteobacteria bacterium]|nr:ABC transporter substrate-binding protein [Alphaproteobacteria bacterium]
MKLRLFAAAGLTAALLIAAPQARAQTGLTVYCSVLADWCQLMAVEFEKQSGIRVNVAQKGSGETLAQIRAEAANPRGDVWWGGTGDPHLQAGELGLTDVYRSPKLEELHPWARRQAEQSGYRTVGIYAGALGIAVNTEQLARKKLTAPRCWKDLLGASFRDEVQMSNPSSSGTAYTAIATFVQVFGEDGGFDYLKQLHRNVSQYTRSGPAPARNTARGETMLGIMFLHDAVAEAVEGFPVAVVSPCEGTGYEIGSMSIIKGARNPDAAKRWYEFALTPEAQALAARAKSYQTPSHPKAAVPAQAPKLSEMKLIDYDFAKYGSSAERKRLIEKWEKEVGSQPK